MVGRVKRVGKVEKSIFAKINSSTKMKIRILGASG